jgi:hypothetical protein
MPFVELGVHVEKKRCFNLMAMRSQSMVGPLKPDRFNQRKRPLSSFWYSALPRTGFSMILAHLDLANSVLPTATGGVLFTARHAMIALVSFEKRR